MGLDFLFGFLFGCAFMWWAVVIPIMRAQPEDTVETPEDWRGP